MKRVIIIVLDSAGIGELPDAAEYGDVGSNTLGNIAASVNGFALPNLEKLGLGNIEGTVGFKAAEEPMGCFGKMAERSARKRHYDRSLGACRDNTHKTLPGIPRRIS